MRFNELEHFPQRFQLGRRLSHRPAIANQDRFRGYDRAAIDRTQVIFAQGRARLRQIGDQIRVAHARRRFHRPLGMHQKKMRNPLPMHETLDQIAVFRRDAQRRPAFLMAQAQIGQIGDRGHVSPRIRRRQQQFAFAKAEPVNHHDIG